MAKKTEKQIEINRLYQQEILTVGMSDCKLGTYVKYGRNRDAMFKMCIINGQRWVQIDQFYNGMWADKLCRDGSLKDGDMLHVKTLTDVGGYGGPKKRLQMHTLFRLEALLFNRDSILDAVYNGWKYQEEQYRLLFDNGMTVAIEADHVIDEERLQRSESAYRRRLQLIAENSKENLRKNIELDEELERRNKEPQTDDQLAQLPQEMVQMITDMLDGYIDRFDRMYWQRQRVEIVKVLMNKLDVATFDPIAITEMADKYIQVLKKYD